MILSPVFHCVMFYSDQQQLHEFPSHQFLVCVKKIPKDMKLDDLSNDIKHKMKSSPPKIAFIEGSGEALLMFNNENGQFDLFCCNTSYEAYIAFCMSLFLQITSMKSK